MAYVRKTPRGQWRAEIERRGVRMSATFDKKAEAVAWAAREEAAIMAGTRGMWPDRTLAEALQRYAKEVSPRKRGRDAERKRLDWFQRTEPDLCAQTLHRIGPDQLAAWRDRRLAFVSAGAVQRDINLLRNVWSVAAREWRWCALESPWRMVRQPGDGEAREQVWRWRQIRLMLRRLDYITGAQPLATRQRVAYAFLLALRTGMRAGELVQLEARDVDTVAGVATVRQHKTRHITGKDRRVPLTRQARRLFALLADGAPAGPLLRLTSSRLDALFRKYRDAVGLHDLRFHDSRATALTLLSRRVPVEVLARISGHRDLKTLLNHYYRETAEGIASSL